MEVEIDLCGEEFETDVEIDFSEVSDKEIEKILKAIRNNGEYTFKEIPVVISGLVTQEVDIQPMRNEGYY